VRIEKSANGKRSIWRNTNWGEKGTPNFFQRLSGDRKGKRGKKSWGNNGVPKKGVVLAKPGQKKKKTSCL